MGVVGRPQRGGEYYPCGRRKPSAYEREAKLAELAENRRGNIKVQERHARYGYNPIAGRVREGDGVTPHDPTADAIGRLHFVAPHLMGEVPKNKLNLAREVHWHYWRHFDGYVSPRSPGCSLQALERRAVRNAGGFKRDLTPEEAKRARFHQDRLNALLAPIDALGHNARRAFDSLVVNINDDSGPDWLDRILMEEMGSGRARNSDWQQLDLALAGLTAIHESKAGQPASRTIFRDSPER